jgi:hypothetical protein
MDLDTATNPAPADEAPAPEVETEAPETEPAEEGEQPSPDDEFEELDIDGKRIKFSKDAKPYVMMHADYTRKTQEAAELKRQAEAQHDEVKRERQFQEENLSTIAQLTAVSSQLEAFAKIDFNQLASEDQDNAQRLYFQYQQLKDAQRELQSSIEGKKREWDTAREQHIATARRQASEALARPDPGYGWGGKFTPELKTNLDKLAYSLGYNDQQLAHAEAKDIKLFNLALIGLNALKKQSTAQKPASTAEPVPQVGAGKARASVNPDKLSDAQWWEAQKKKAGR